MNYSLQEIADKIGASVHGDGSCQIESLATLADANTGNITFLSNSKYKSQLINTKASAVIVNEECLADCPTNALVMKNPYIGYAMVAQLLDSTPKPANNIHPSAVIDKTATLGSQVTIGANAVIDSYQCASFDIDMFYRPRTPMPERCNGFKRYLIQRVEELNSQHAQS